jgi:hypothetical protein
MGSLRVTAEVKQDAGSAARLGALATVTLLLALANFLLSR